MSTLNKVALLCRRSPSLSRCTPTIRAVLGQISSLQFPSRKSFCLRQFCYKTLSRNSQGFLTTTLARGQRGQYYFSDFRRRMIDDELSGLDDTQAMLMQEECILVDINDKRIGSASKKTCHLLENINKGMLHRAFSVFLFNTTGELLLQQRATEKITFPDHFTNTCCSHPLNFPDELEEEDAIGVKRAAQRKLMHELGIKPEQVPLQDFHFLTRILYKAENIPKDNKWGEYEIDYILFIQRDVDVVANPNEVKSYRYVSQSELKDIVDLADRTGVLLTPWFRLIVENFLDKWWNNLDHIQSQANTDTIHRPGYH